MGFDSVTSIHLVEERKTPSKFVRERALTMTSKGPTWVEVVGMGCSEGFYKIKPHLSQTERKQTIIGLATFEFYPMKLLVELAESLLDKDPKALACDNAACLSCNLAAH